MESNRENITNDGWTKAESSYKPKRPKNPPNQKRTKNKKPKLYNFDSKQTFVQEIISQYPDKPEEFIDEKIIENLIPQYNSYHYDIDASDEFSIEIPLHKNIMLEYHTNPCNPNCKRKDCINYHKDEERRRPPKRMPNGLWNYRPRLCNYLDNCSEGDLCTFSHTEDELKYHPLKYKTKPCRFISKNAKCDMGEFCPFAHDDLRTPSSFSIKNQSQPSSFSISQQNESSSKSGNDSTIIEPENSTIIEEESKQIEKKEVKNKIREPKISQNQIEKEIKILLDENARLDELIKDEQDKIEALSFYICAYCQSDMPIYVMNCGHLCCSSCKGSICKVCKAPIRSKLIIKDIQD